VVVQAFYNLSYSPDSYTHMNKVPKTCLFFQMHGQCHCHRIVALAGGIFGWMIRWFFSWLIRWQQH